MNGDVQQVKGLLIGLRDAYQRLPRNFQADVLEVLSVWREEGAAVLGNCEGD